MNVKAKPNWVEEVDGTWWYYRPGAASGRHRFRGEIKTCKGCGNHFPTVIGKPGNYCSLSCTGKNTAGARPKTRADLFAEWTPDECWLAGLIWSDGCLHEKGQRHQVILHMTDEQVIADAAAVAGVRYSTYKPQPKDVLPHHAIFIGDRNAIRHLRDRGLEPRKSLTAEWPHPDLPHPDAFLRGAFDGDGSVSYKGGGRTTMVTTLCGSYNFLDGANTLLARHGITAKKISPHGRIHVLQWGHADSIRIGAIMYADGGPHLERKKAIFDRYVPLTQIVPPAIR